MSAQIGFFFALTLENLLCLAFVLSRLDYSNSLLFRPLCEKLQKVQNSAARHAVKAHKRDHISLLLRTLLWLPIQARIEYKLTALCHSFFSDTAPVYLLDFLRVSSPSRQLRFFSDSRILRIPHIIIHIQSTIAFKTALKTVLFKSYLC